MAAGIAEEKPIVVGVPIGDPNGIGPEVAVKAFLKLRHADFISFLIGDAAVVDRALGMVEPEARISVETITDPEKIRKAPGIINVLDSGADKTPVTPGRVSAEAGKAALDALTTGVRLAMTRRVDAIACAPANKSALRLAGSPYKGQTELIGALTGAKNVGTVIVSGEFRVFQATSHVSLRQACDLITMNRVLANIRLAGHSLKEDFGIKDPLIAVSGLNPHAGDGGLLGEEEQKEIIPAIEQARAEGFRVDGPIPGDALFVKVRREGHDGVIAMYHDQSNAVLKFISSELVTVNIGLPIVRTTVGHGTGFDIAWKGVADPGCMTGAIELAARLATVRRNRDQL